MKPKQGGFWFKLKWRLIHVCCISIDVEDDVDYVLPPTCD